MRFFLLLFFLFFITLTFGQKITSAGTDSSEYLKLIPFPFNSEFPEFAPVLSWDGNELFFAKSNAPGNLGLANHTNIWQAKRQKDLSWNSPVNVGRPLNSEAHNFPLYLSPLGQKIYLSRVQATGTHEILTTTAKGRTWRNPNPLDIPWLTDGSFITLEIKALHLSYDERVLLLLADTQQGCGRLDIYASLKDLKGHWSYPFNLGPVINSELNECSVFLASDNQTLYFASNGHGGEGGYDLFLSRRNDESWLNWSEPVNLGNVINSTADELDPAMSLIGDELFFSRKKKNGEQDLFSCFLTEALQPQPRHILFGKVSLSRGQLQAALMLESSGSFPPPVLQSSGGRFLSVLPTENAYLLYAPAAPGYYAESLAFFHSDYFDGNAPSLWNALQEKASYQERESKIRQIKNEKEALHKKIDKLVIKQTSFFTALQEQLSSTLDRLEWNDGEKKRLKELREQYTNLSEKTIHRDSSETTHFEKKQPENGQISKDAHFKIMKERLRRQLAQTAPPAESKELSIKAPTSPLSFDQFLQTLFHQWLNKMAATLWREKALQLFPDQLQELQDQVGREEVERLSKFGIPEDENPALAEQALSTFPISRQAAFQPWQHNMAEELSKALEKPFYDQLPSLMEPFVGELLQNKILLASVRHQAFFLYQDLQTAVDLQISEEQKQKRIAGEEVRPPKKRPVFSTTQQLIQEHNFKAFPIREGTTIPLPGIVFEPNSARLSPISEPEITRCIRLLQDQPELNVEIGVYAYGELTHSLALDLCTQRAEILYRFIAEQGISKERLSWKGYGKKEVVPHKYPWRNNIVILKIMK